MSLNKLSKRFFAVGVSTGAMREITDALVIFSMSILAYMSIADWGGLSVLERLLGTHLESPPFLYFGGIALAVFSTRRIADQRRERAKRVEAERNAQAASMRDPLTQLPNRRQFQSDVNDALKNSSNKMSVLLLGLDQFKKLNEVYGHLGCDEALSQIGSRIRDRAAPGDIFARIGDDEFALCLAGADPETARKIACSLVEIVNKPVQIGIEQHSIGANVGIAQAGRGHMTVDELLRCAHVALSRARNGRTTYCFFDPRMDAHVRERSLLEKDLRAGIGGDQIRPYYQPIVDLRTRRIVSFESLGRWHHPVSGLIPPDVFVPLAEELDLLNLVSGQLFGDACRDAVKWRDDISLSFNFSPSQLNDRRFADAVLTVLKDTGLPPHRLEAEITESAIVADLEATRHAIQTLRKAGVRVVIDDFGTGYSSLYHLYELRFDKLKIDRRFIQELTTTSESQIFMRAIVGLCKGLNLSVTAEGIETEAQAAAAFQHGVQQGQGFLFGKAVPANEVLRLLSASPPVRLVA
jgi:diguanylate cyclase (GGDEF)-like protein